MNTKRTGAAVLLAVGLWAGPAVADAPLHLTLTDALRLAVVNSPDLAAYRSKIRQAEWQEQEARSPGRPQLEFDASYTQIDPPVAVSFGGSAVEIIAEHNYKIGPTLKQAIATFGRLHYRLLAAQLNEQSLRNDYRRVADTLLETVATDYDRTLEAQEIMDVAQAAVGLREAHVTDSRKLFSAGTVARYDVIRDESALKLSQQELITAQDQYQKAMAGLLSALGIDPHQAVVLDPVPPPTAPPTDRDAGVQAAVAHRPELGVLHYSFLAARANADYARSTLNPNISLQATYIEQNNTGFQTPNQFQGTLALQVPIFDGGLAKSQMHEAEEQAEQLRQQYESAHRQVLVDVENAWIDLQTSWQKLDVANQNVKDTEQLAHVAEVRYRGGIGTNLERLDADNNLIEVRSTAVRALYEYHQAEIEWLRATAQAYPAEVQRGIEQPPFVTNSPQAPQPAQGDKPPPGLVSPGSSSTAPVVTPP